MPRALLPLALLVACASEPAREHTAVLYGEEFIEEGIPADEFVDGWSVTFSKFLVSLGDVTLSGEPLGDVGARFQIFDLARASGGAGFPVGAVTLGVTDPQVGYVIAPSPDPVAGNADPADVALMKQGGYSVYVVGRAARGDATLTFTWGFATRTVYSDCRYDRADPIELTIHGDHLFYDDLFSAEPNLAFDLIAGADQGDGDVSPDDLRAVDITAEARYQVGDLTHITDLWAFIEQQTTTLGHISGEGHCGAIRED